MKKVAAVCAAVLLLSAGKGYAYDDHDFQVWNVFSQEMKLGKKWTAALEEELHFGDNAREFFYQHYDLSAAYSPLEWMSVGAGYRHILAKSKGDIKVENAPYMTFFLMKGLAGFKFDDRSRVEYEHFGYQDDVWRYRNKVTVKMPWKFTRLAIQPFLADEVFVRLSGNSSLNQNRASAGVGMSLTRHLKAEVSYMLQSYKSAGAWQEANVLGTKVKYVF